MREKKKKKRNKNCSNEVKKKSAVGITTERFDSHVGSRLGRKKRKKG